MKSDLGRRNLIWLPNRDRNHASYSLVRIRWDVYVSSVPGRSAKANGCHTVSGSAEHREEGSAVFC